MTRRGLRRALAVALVAGALFPASRTVLARPVRIGRFAELPFGVSDAHPHVTAGVDRRRSGRSRLAAPSRAPTLRFRASLRVGAPTGLVVDDHGSIIVVGALGLASLRADGTLRGERSFSRALGAPSIDPAGRVWVMVRSSRLLSFDFDGREAGEQLVAGELFGSPLVLDDGSMVLPAFDEVLRRIDPDGRVVFERFLGGGVLSREAALVGADRFAIGVGQEIVLVDLDGRVVWRTPIDQRIVAGPAVGRDDTIWVVDVLGHVLALGPDGRVRARAEVPGRMPPTTSIAVGSDGSIRFVGPDGAIHCFGAGGVERWSLAQEGTFQGPVTLDANDTLLAVSTQGKLVSVGANGEVRWRLEVGARSLVPPALAAPGVVLVLGVDGTLQSFGE